MNYLSTGGTSRSYSLFTTAQFDENQHYNASKGQCTDYCGKVYDIMVYYDGTYARSRYSDACCDYSSQLVEMTTNLCSAGWWSNNSYSRYFLTPCTHWNTPSDPRCPLGWGNLFELRGTKPDPGCEDGCYYANSVAAYDGYSSYLGSMQ